jgi:hypothetical protein
MWGSGAAFLGVNWSTAQSNASSEFAKNMASGATATYTQSTTYIANDTIQVTVNRQAQTFFAKIFGKTSVSLNRQGDDGAEGRRGTAVGGDEQHLHAGGPPTRSAG